MIPAQLIGVILIILCSCGQKDRGNSTYGTIQYQGLYALGGDPEKGRVGSVLVYSETDSTILFFLEINMGAPAYHLGQLYGRISIDENTGVYNEKLWFHDNRCKLRFELREESLIIEYLNEHDDDCGFGAYVSAAGEYHRMNRLQPDFFQDQNGDTIYFGQTSPERYNEDDEQ